MSNATIVISEKNIGKTISFHSVFSSEENENEITGELVSFEEERFCVVLKHDIYSLATGINEHYFAGEVKSFSFFSTWNFKLIQ